MIELPVLMLVLMTYTLAYPAAQDGEYGNVRVVRSPDPDPGHHHYHGGYGGYDGYDGDYGYQGYGGYGNQDYGDYGYQGYGGYGNQGYNGGQSAANANSGSINTPFGSASFASANANSGGGGGFFR